MRRQVTQVIVTPLTTGTRGRISIDNLALVNMLDAGMPPALPAGKGITVQDFAGSTQSQLYAYQQHGAAQASFSSGLVNSAAGKALQVSFSVPSGNDWAGVLAVTPLQASHAPMNLQAISAVRLDLAAQGSATLRVELQAEGVDTGTDNPQFRLTVDPALHTYRLPISAFAQAGYGKPVDVPSFLKRVSSVAVYADTVGTKGSFTLANIVLERP